MRSTTFLSHSVRLARTTFFSSDFLTVHAHFHHWIFCAYKLSMLVLWRTSVTPNMIEVYNYRDYTRFFQKLMNSRQTQTESAHMLRPGTAVCYYYKSSKHTKPTGWKNGLVLRTREHLINILSDKGKPTSVVYKNTRIRSQLNLTKDLIDGIIEDSVADVSEPLLENDALNLSSSNVNGQV